MKLPSLSAKLVLAFAIVILNLPTPAIAQSIASLQTNLTKKSSALSTLENRIISYGQRQLDAEEKLQEALQDLSDATSELETARQNTGPEAANQQTLASKKVDLARNALESRQSRLTSAREKYTALMVEKQTTEAEIAAITALIAKKQVAATSSKAVIAAPQPAPVATQPLIVAANTTQPELTPPTPVQPAPNLASSVSSSAVTEEENESEIAEPTQRQLYAQRQMAELNERIKGADKDGWRKFSTLALRIDNGELIEFEFLGNHQYYAEFTLNEGKHKVKVRRRSFAIDVPSEEHGNTFVALYDTRDKYKAEFSIFNKSLLD